MLLTGQIWKPAQGLFGFLPFIMGTIWVTTVAMAIAVPPCLLAAIYLAEYAGQRLKTVFKPLLDLLTAIPSVVYGVWGMLTIVPWVQECAETPVWQLVWEAALFNSTNPTGFSILSGSLVLSVMVAPFMISMIYEVLHTVPEDLRHASLALGATRWQTVRKVVMPVILPGVAAGIVLGSSARAGRDDGGDDGGWKRRQNPGLGL